MASHGIETAIRISDQHQGSIRNAGASSDYRAHLENGSPKGGFCLQWVLWMAFRKTWFLSGSCWPPVSAGVQLVCGPGPHTRQNSRRLKASSSLKRESDHYWRKTATRATDRTNRRAGCGWILARDGP